jgi:hypothetical protein
MNKQCIIPDIPARLQSLPDSSGSKTAATPNKEKPENGAGTCDHVQKNLQEGRLVPIGSIGSHRPGVRSAPRISGCIPGFVLMYNRRRFSSEYSYAGG